MSPPWMPFYVADYLAATRRLTTLEHGCYMLLIMEYWQHGGLPKADQRLARIVQLSDREWAKVRPIVKSFFDEDWRHKRIDAELAKSTAKNEARINAGRIGGKQKASNARNSLDPPDKQNSTDALASSSQPQSQDTSLRSVSRSRATRLLADWQPSHADLAYAAEQGLSLPEALREAENFRDFWIAKSGQNGTKNDWPATWRTWIRRSIENRRARAGPSRAGGGLTMAEMARMDEPDFLDDQHRNQPRDGPAEAASDPNESASGFAGRLPLSARANAGRRVVDL